MPVSLQPRPADADGEWRVASARFPAVPAAVPEARRFVRRHVADPTLLDRALLLVSELATNAVEHAGTAFEVTVVTGRDSVRIEVADGSSRPPAVRYPAVDAERGRGMRIVEGLATQWGVGGRPGADGKVVWCELLRPERPGPDLRSRRTG